MTGMHLSDRGAVLVVLGAQALIAVALLFSFAYTYRAQGASREADASLASRNCLQIEVIKHSMREVFEQLSAFNASHDVPFNEVREKLYDDFVNDYFSPSPCPR